LNHITYFFYNDLFWKKKWGVLVKSEGVLVKSGGVLVNSGRFGKKWGSFGSGGVLTCLPSLDGPLPKLCPVIQTSNQYGRQAKNRKKGGCNFNCPLLL
jgi:hypothetical protein